MASDGNGNGGAGGRGNGGNGGPGLGLTGNGGGTGDERIAGDVDATAAAQAAALAEAARGLAGGGSGTAAAAAAVERRLGGTRGSRVRTGNFRGYVKQSTTVSSLNFTLAAMDPDKALDAFDLMVERMGYSTSNPTAYSDVMDTIYSVFYKRHASDQLALEDTVHGYGGVTVDLNEVREVLKPLVGTNYRRWVRGVANVFYDMAITNFDRFREMFEERQKEWNLPTVEDAIAAMDGMDGCTKLPGGQKQRNAVAREVALRVKGKSQGQRLLDTTSVALRISGSNGGGEDSVG